MNFNGLRVFEVLATLKLKSGESRLSNNPNALTPWGLSHRLSMNQRIRKIETVTIEVNGSQQIADVYHADTDGYLCYRQGQQGENRD